MFSMWVNVMRSAYNLEPKYRVMMLTSEEWTKGTGTPPPKLQSRGSSGLQMGPRCRRGPRLGSISNMRKEGSASLYENMPQFFRLRYMLPWPVLMK
jgi:hypothetical protein